MWIGIYLEITSLQALGVLAWFTLPYVHYCVTVLEACDSAESTA